MLRVTVEIVPDGDEERTQTLGVMTVTNDNLGHDLGGHYDVSLKARNDSYRQDWYTVAGRVDDYNRERGWLDLVYFALETVNPVKRSMTIGRSQ